MNKFIAGSQFLKLHFFYTGHSYWKHFFAYLNFQILFYVIAIYDLSNKKAVDNEENEKKSLKQLDYVVNHVIFYMFIIISYFLSWYRKGGKHCFILIVSPALFNLIPTFIYVTNKLNCTFYFIVDLRFVRILSNCLCCLSRWILEFLQKVYF